MKLLPVVMIMLDQIRCDSLSRHPVFKRLKERGVFCSEMISYAPYTSASLYAVMTGIYGCRSGMNAYYAGSRFKKEECRTLAQYLRDKGSFTQVDIVNPVLIPHQGFDLVSQYDELCDDLAARHIGILESSRQKNNFFVFLGCGVVHGEMVKNVTQQYKDFDGEYFGHIERNRAQYESYVAKACVYLEHLLDYLDKSALDQQALTVIFTDHGVGLGEKPGEKTYGVYAYDYSLRSWAHFYCPKLLVSTCEIQELTRSVDIMPTVLELLNIKPSRRYMAMDGASILPLMNAKQQDSRIAFSETGGLEGPYPSPHWPNIASVRDKEWKLIYNLQTRQKEMYNIVTDSAEMNNLSGTHLAVEEELWNKLQTYLKQAAQPCSDPIITREYQKLGYLPNE
jgi:arylsulfatase A-like enzyme